MQFGKTIEKFYNPRDRRELYVCRPFRIGSGRRRKHSSKSKSWTITKYIIQSNPMGGRRKRSAWGSVSSNFEAPERGRWRITPDYSKPFTNGTFLHLVYQTKFRGNCYCRGKGIQWERKAHSVCVLYWVGIPKNGYLLSTATQPPFSKIITIPLRAISTKAM